MPSIQHVNYSMETCHPCKWFHRRLWKSGQNPIYHSECRHPSQLHESGLMGEKGRQLGDKGSMRTRRPDWCPIRGDDQADLEAQEEE
jgi:hypothetical protein